MIGKFCLLFKTETTCGPIDDLYQFSNKNVGFLYNCGVFFPAVYCSMKYVLFIESQ